MDVNVVFYCSMNFLHTLLDNSTFPILSAFVLGIMMTISPCPFCSNITAIGFIGKDVKSKKTVMLNGVMYVLGKMVAYFVLALFFWLGADMLNVRAFFETYGEPALGPFLILCGLFMMGIFRFHHHDHSKPHTHGGKWSDKLLKRSKAGSAVWAFVLGVVLSLAFCPYSGVIFLGMLVPLSIAEPMGFLLPLVFGFATGLPVLLIAWLLAYSVASIAKVYDKVQVFEVWFRRICAGLFLIMGIYLTVEIHMGHHHHEEGSVHTETLTPETHQHHHDCEHQ